MKARVGFLEAMAGDIGDVTQGPLPGEHCQPVHRGPDGVLDPGAAPSVEHAGVGQFVEYSAELIQGRGVLRCPAVLSVVCVLLGQGERGCSIPVGGDPSITPMIPRPRLVTATRTSTGLAVAQKMVQTSGTALTGFSTLTGKPSLSKITNECLIADKYRFDMIIFRPLRFVQARLHLGRPRTEPAILGITPS